MKHLKKISRDQLKKVKGGDNRDGICRPGYMYVCDAVGICGPEEDAACNCYCFPIIPNP